MTREQAINYLISSGFTHEQVGEVVRALTYEPTTKNDPKFCPDRKAKTTHMETLLHCVEDECVAYKDGKCLKYNSDQEPTTKNDLGVDTISRQAVIDLMMQKWGENFSGDDAMQESIDAIRELPSVTPQLSVPEVTALAEWIEKLTKASEDAYNKGYEDGMKAQAEPKTKIEESNFSREQYALDIDTAWKCGYEAGKKENAPVNICPHCGEYIGEEE